MNTNVSSSSVTEVNLLEFELFSVFFFNAFRYSSKIGETVARDRRNTIYETRTFMPRQTAATTAGGVMEACSSYESSFFYCFVHKSDIFKKHIRGTNT